MLYAISSIAYKMYRSSKDERHIKTIKNIVFCYLFLLHNQSKVIQYSTNYDITKY